MRRTNYLPVTVVFVMIIAVMMCIMETLSTNPTTSTPSASIKSGAISPNIWYGSTTLTGAAGGSSLSACRNWHTELTCIPVTALAPRSKGTRSGCS